MKKIMFLSLVVLCAVCGETIAATYDCRVQPLKILQGTFRKDGAIFLYPTVGNYRSDDALVCGHQRTDGCDDRTRVVVAGHHVFRGVTQTDMKVYTCDSVGWLNEWNDSGYTSLPECKDGQERSWDRIGVVNDFEIYCNNAQNTFYSGNYCLNACFYRVGNPVSPVTPVTPTADCDKAGYEIATEDINLTTICPECSRIVKGQCYESEMLRCYEAIKRGEPANWNGKTCNCGNVDGVKYSWNTKLKRCEAATGKSCAELYKGYPERIACCKAGRYTKWEGAKDSGQCICVNPDTKIPNPDLEWVYDATTQTGTCNYKKPDEPKPDDPKPEIEKPCEYVFHGEFKCANGRRLKKDVKLFLDKKDLKGMTCDQFKKMYDRDANQIKDLFKEACEDKDNFKPLDAATKKAISNISSFFDMSMSDRNVWRNAEGEFNTARLASDATAGVVLGTVGGVVSANIIKKKQLEKGFDVLHCIVGGQKMADYGDIFQVSFRR